MRKENTGFKPRIEMDSETGNKRVYIGGALFGAGVGGLIAPAFIPNNTLDQVSTFIGSGAAIIGGELVLATELQRSRRLTAAAGKVVDTYKNAKKKAREYVLEKTSPRMKSAYKTFNEAVFEGEINHQDTTYKLTTPWKGLIKKSERATQSSIEKEVLESIDEMKQSGLYDRSVLESMKGLVKNGQIHAGRKGLFEHADRKAGLGTAGLTDYSVVFNEERKSQIPDEYQDAGAFLQSFIEEGDRIGFESARKKVLESKGEWRQYRFSDSEGRDPYTEKFPGKKDGFRMTVRFDFEKNDRNLVPGAQIMEPHLYFDDGPIEKINGTVYHELHEVYKYAAAEARAKKIAKKSGLCVEEALTDDSRLDLASRRVQAYYNSDDRSPSGEDIHAGMEMNAAFAAYKILEKNKGKKAAMDYASSHVNDSFETGAITRLLKDADSPKAAEGMLNAVVNHDMYDLRYLLRIDEEDQKTAKKLLQDYAPASEIIRTAAEYDESGTEKELIGMVREKKYKMRTASAIVGMGIVTGVLLATGAAIPVTLPLGAAAMGLPYAINKIRSYRK